MSNVNYLAATNFRGSIQRLPETTFQLQKTNIPGINGSEVIVPTKLNPIKETYDKLDYTHLNWTFLVDENMKNYTEIFNWIYGIGFPQDHSQYKNLELRNLLKSDISVIILNNSRNPIKEFIFHDAFPVALSDLMFDTTTQYFQTLEATVVFTYNYFTMNDIN